jgi:transcriptional regulator with XRE-family HTH domain
MQRDGKKYLQLLGQKIKEIRLEKKVSQQELADHADIAKSTIQRIENGEMNATILMLRSISLALEVELTMLVKEPK